MPRPATKFLTDAELRIMRILWRRGSATIADIGEDLKPRSARATIQTMLRIMERKRYVRHRAAGRSFVYRPVLDAAEAGDRAVRHLLSNFFSPPQRALVSRILKAKDLDPGTVERMRRILDARGAHA